MSTPKKHRAAAKPTRPARKAKVVVQQIDAPAPTPFEQPFAGEPVANGLTRFWNWLKG